MPLSPFHLAIQVRDISEAREFYGGLIGCAEGRSSAHWVDFNLYGHQLVCHLNPGLGKHGRIDSHYNPVDGDQVPVPHFGIVLPMNAWQELAARLSASGIAFVVQPHVRFARPASRRRFFSWTRPAMRWNSRPSRI